MKTKNGIRLLMILIAVIGISVAGCKKDKTTDTTSMQQLAKDNAQVQASDDHITSDVNDVLSREGAKSMLDSIPNSCTITIDTVGFDTLRYTLVYNGFSLLHNFNRTGTVIIKKLIGTHWYNAGTTVWFSYVNLQITKISTGKTFTFNGGRAFQNVSGGLIKYLGTSATSIEHKITGSMEVTFEDGTSRTWTISRTRTFTGSYPSALVMTVNGFGSANGYNNIVEYGVNRNGETFYDQINNSVVFNQSCDWDPCSGVRVFQIPADTKSATCTFGYDNNNQLVTGGACPTKYKVDWVKGSNSGTVYLSL